jgi:DNA-directed RNA polymerase specialized sigma subunit
MKSVSFLISELDASKREEALSVLVECISQLPSKPKKVLAMYYYEGFHVADIAMCLALTEYEVDQIRATALGLVRTALSGWLARRR